jgi:hypothetical protein
MELTPVFCRDSQQVCDDGRRYGYVREVVGRHLSEEEVLHPWHPEYEAWLRFKETHTEFESWLEENPRQ